MQLYYDLYAYTNKELEPLQTELLQGLYWIDLHSRNQSSALSPDRVYKENWSLWGEKGVRNDPKTHTVLRE